MSILYITHDGVTDHIGRSQVAPYVLALARAGFRIHVLSAEKRGRDALVADYQRQFDEAGVRWTRVRYSNRPPVLGQAFTLIAMKRAAHRIIRQEAVRVLHCRSFLPALIAYAIKPATGIRYIFDFRDFYADGGLKKSKGLARLVFRYLKHREGSLIRNADKVVCLTKSARGLLVDWYLRDDPHALQRFQVIPCCADFNHFDTSKLPDSAATQVRVEIDVSPEAFVLVYLGSLGPDYLLDKMVACFRQLLRERPDSVFLFICNNGRELVEREFDKQSVARHHLRVVSADRNEVPRYLNIASMSILFIRPDVSKSGCSPTKLAELFACNIPVIANTGVGDLDSIISPDRNGSVLVSDFSDETMHAAIHDSLEIKPHAGSIRSNSREFALEEGVRRYAAVYCELLGTKPPLGESAC